MEKGNWNSEKAERRKWSKWKLNDWTRKQNRLNKISTVPPVWTIPCCWQWSKYNTSCAIVRVHEGCQTSVRNSSNNGSQFYIRVEFRNDLLGFWRSCLFSKQKQKAPPAAGRQQTPIAEMSGEARFRTERVPGREPAHRGWASGFLRLGQVLEYHEINNSKRCWERFPSSCSQSLGFHCSERSALPVLC